MSISVRVASSALTQDRSPCSGRLSVKAKQSLILMTVHSSILTYTFHLNNFGQQDSTWNMPGTTLGVGESGHSRSGREWARVATPGVGESGHSTP